MSYLDPVAVQAAAQAAVDGDHGAFYALWSQVPRGQAKAWLRRFASVMLRIADAREAKASAS
ncbi:hypothetical protein EBU91_02360 [bacterium]|nr:hypothetical protein [bacterium]